VSFPTFFGQSTAASNTDATTADWPAGHQADDIGLLVVETANQPVSTPAGWTALESGGVGTAGSATATGLQTFWKRATSAAEANVTVANPGDHRRCRILVFRGCETSGNPFDVSDAAGDITSTTARTIPGHITNVAECLVVLAISNATDITSNQTTASGFVNADLANIVRVSTGNSASGNGGGYDIATGEKAVAGTFGDTAVTLANASTSVGIVIAFKPPAVVGGTVTEGGIYVATGVKSSLGLVSATTATMDAASVQALLFFALKPPTAPPVNLPPFVEAIADREGAVDLETTFSVDISDPEGDTLTVTLVDDVTSVPAGATLAQDDSDTWIFSWTPTSAQVGEWTFGVEVDDGTNTVTRVFTITVLTEPTPTLLDVALAIAERAQADLQAAQALADLMEEREQMNAAVLHKTRTLIADMATSVDYMTDVIQALEEQEDQLQ
jgi:hypothetical protein